MFQPKSKLCVNSRLAAAHLDVLSTGYAKVWEAQLRVPGGSQIAP